jgi:hypothetical protein
LRQAEAFRQTHAFGIYLDALRRFMAIIRRGRSSAMATACRDHGAG